MKKKSKAGGGDKFQEGGFSTYLSRAFKKQHGTDRIVSASTLATLDDMTDFLIKKLLDNSRHALKYGKTSTLNGATAKAATALTLTGPLKTTALKAGALAVQRFSEYKAPEPTQAV